MHIETLPKGFIYSLKEAAPCGTASPYSFYSGFFAPQPAQNLPPFPVWPQFGQVHSPSSWGLGDPHSGQKLPVFPSVPHFGQVQGAGTGAAFGGWGVI